MHGELIEFLASCFVSFHSVCPAYFFSRGAAREAFKTLALCDRAILGSGTLLTRCFTLLLLILGVFIESFVNFFDIFWPVIAIEHGVRPENVLSLFVGFQNGPHFLYLIAFLLAVGQLFLEECGDISWLITHIDGRLEGALLHFVLDDFFLELLKFLTHLSAIDTARLSSILLVFFAYA